MSFTTECPHCDARQSARDSDRGLKIRCRECDERFVARPARRSSDDRDRRGKQSGLPVLLIVLLAVGALVLVGGGVGVVLYLKSGKPADPFGPPGAGGPAASGPPVSTANWVDFADAEARYRVKFPQQPVIEEQFAHRPDGPVKQKHVVCRRPSVSFYAASNPLPPGSDPQQVLAREMDNAWGRTPWNGTVSRRTAVTQQGRPGRELEMSATSDRAYLRMFVANDRFYVLLAWGERLRSDNPEVAAFFQSLAFD
jgi:hypothetical protein